MDRALKERIIGAAVLVVFVVLVVPVFLDGPSDEDEIISERVPLPGQENHGEPRTVVLERDRDEPVPVAVVAEATEASPEPQKEPQKEPQTEPQREAQQEAPTQVAATQVAAPEPVPRQHADTPPPAGTSSTGMWAVQLGSFGNQQNAERLAADLRKQGFAAFLSQLPTDSGQLHRVRIGPQKDRESAEAMAARLQKAGHKGQVVPHP